MSKKDLYDPARVVRFWDRVDRADLAGCWIWRGAVTPKGYGRFAPRIEGSVVRIFAHRYAYELIVGPVPDGLVLDHLCRNRACCNPAHLEPVTVRENLHRGETLAALNAAKIECVNGHTFDVANTYISPKGFRECRACRAEASRRHQARRRAA